MQEDINYPTIVPAPKTIRGYLSTIDVNDTHLLYFNGNTVIVKALDEKHLTFSIVHVSEVAAVKYSPNGRLIASIDSKGTLLTHQICPQKLILVHKIENCFPSAKSLDWTADGKRICVVGEGKKQFGRVVMLDTGMNVGEIGYVTSTLNSCSFRPERPYKLAVGGDENQVKFYDGPPYNFVKSDKAHNGFINQIKYSPKGNHVVTGGADRKIVVYHGGSFEKTCEKENAHNGGIFGIDWADEDHFITVSSDKSIKIWNLKCEEIYNIQTASPEDMINPKKIQYFLVAVRAWKKLIYVVNLTGDILVYENPLFTQHKTQLEVISHARSKTISMINHKDTLILFDNGGRILQYSFASKKTKAILTGVDIKSIVRATVVKDRLYVLREDGCLAVVDLSTTTLIKIIEAPIFKQISAGVQSNQILGYVNNKVVIFNTDTQKIVAQATLAEEVSCLKMNSRVIVVGTMKGNVHVFNSTLKLLQKVQVKTFKITALSLIQLSDKSSDFLFVGDSYGSLKLLQISGDSITVVRDGIGGHNTVITGIQYDNQHIYTVSMDGNLNVWGREDVMKKKTINNIVKGGIIGITVLEDRIAVSGGDLLVKFVNKAF